MRIFRRLLGAFATACVLATASAPAGADDWLYRDRDIHRFRHHYLDAWLHGRWRHERHNGVRGWWWFSGGLWYFYPRPVYPYPDPYVPPYAVVPPPVDAPPAYWYYCSNPRGYFPYVPQCYGYWHKVPAAP